MVFCLKTWKGWKICFCIIFWNSLNCFPFPQWSFFLMTRSYWYENKKTQNFKSYKICNKFSQYMYSHIYWYHSQNNHPLYMKTFTSVILSLQSRGKICTYCYNIFFAELKKIFCILLNFCIDWSFSRFFNDFFIFFVKTSCSNRIGKASFFV